MEIREIPRQDYARLAQLQSVAFHAPNPKLVDPVASEAEFDRSHAETLPTYGARGNRIRRLGSYIDDRLVSSLELMPFTVHFDGHDCEMGGIAGVASDPVIRRQGTVRALILQAFAEMKAAGQVFSYLQPVTRIFYSKFGFEMSAEKIAWTIPLEFMPRPDSTGIEHYEGTDRQKDDIRAVYRSHIQNYNLSVQREETLAWKPFFASIEPYRTDVFSFLHRNPQGKANAFLSYRIARSATGEVVLDAGPAFYFISPKGLKALLAFLATYSYHANSARLYLPPSVDLNPVLPENRNEGRSVRREILTFGMARVVDARAVLAKARYRGAGSFSMRLADEHCPWNDKTFEVSFGTGKTVVSEREDPVGDVDIELDIKAFTSLITGKRWVDEADYIPDIQVHGNLENLRKAFYWKPIWLDDFF